jgi:chromosome segregation ATPase
MPTDIASQLQALKDKAAQADRERAAADARVTEAKSRLKEIDDQITALGVKPDEAEAQVAALEAQLATDIAAINAQLDAELAAYKALAS